MKKITKREVYAFILGIISVFILDSILNWEDSINAFNKGYEEVRIK